MTMGVEPVVDHIGHEWWGVETTRVGFSFFVNNEGLVALSRGVLLPEDLVDRVPDEFVDENETTEGDVRSVEYQVMGCEDCSVYFTEVVENEAVRL